MPLPSSHISYKEPTACPRFNGQADAPQDQLLEAAKYSLIQALFTSTQYETHIKYLSMLAPWIAVYSLKNSFYPAQ